MGFFDKLKALGDPRFGIESAIETQAKVFNSVRERHPERDPNAWLALTLGGRPGWGGKPEIYYYEQTAVFSLASDEASVRGLGLLVAIREATNARISEQILAPYDAEFGQILASVFRHSTDSLVGWWETLNPWTAEHYPDVELASDLNAEPMAVAVTSRTSPSS